MTNMDSVGGLSVGQQNKGEKCPQCSGSHPGLKPGDPMPDDAMLRRGIPADKVKPDGSIAKSAFKDQTLSVDIAANRTPAETLSPPHLQSGKYVEFTVKEAKKAFPGNEVVFDCIPDNPHHCEVRGRKTDGQCNKFSEKMRSRLKSS